MLKEERFQYILGKLSEDQKVTLKTLSKELGISEYTVRRDLKELTDQGLVEGCSRRRDSTFTDSSPFPGQVALQKR